MNYKEAKRKAREEGGMADYLFNGWHSGVNRNWLQRKLNKWKRKREGRRKI